jgi:hypothetical protein
MTTYTRIKQEGKIEEQTKFILNGSDNNICVSLLANVTQLTEDEVLSILRKHNKIS